jgi:hypothetical protein
MRPITRSAHDRGFVSTYRRMVAVRDRAPGVQRDRDHVGLGQTVVGHTARLDYHDPCLPVDPAHIPKGEGHQSGLDEGEIGRVDSRPKRGTARATVSHDPPSRRHQ